MNKEKIEALQTAVEYIQKLYAGIITASEHLREGKFAKGCEFISVITEGIDWLVEVVKHTQEELAENIDTSKMNELGEELIEAIGNEDTILMADLLEYEMAEEVENLYTIIVRTVNQHTVEMNDEN